MGVREIPFDGFDEIGGGGLPHTLEKVVQTQEHVSVLHSNTTLRLLSLFELELELEVPMND